jgi:hypothetical protein
MAKDNIYAWEKRRVATADKITTPITSLIDASNVAEGTTTKKLININ